MEMQADFFTIFAKHMTVETKRLILRPITLADAPAMFTYACDEETTRYVFPTHQSLTETEQAIANYFLKEPIGKYAIENKLNHKMIGTIDLRVNERLRNGELGYTLHKECWGKGLIPEAAKALLEVGFGALDLVSIRAEHDTRNEKSGKVMQKIGMKYIGMIEDERIWKGEIVSMVLYSITKKEWKQQMN